MSRVMINIGTCERPCFVPEDALFVPQSPSGNSWWEEIATGSITVANKGTPGLKGISEKNLARALKISGKTGGSSGN